MGIFDQISQEVKSFLGPQSPASPLLDPQMAQWEAGLPAQMKAPGRDSVQSLMPDEAGLAAMSLTPWGAPVAGGVGLHHALNEGDWTGALLQAAGLGRLAAARNLIGGRSPELPPLPDDGSGPKARANGSPASQTAPGPPGAQAPPGAGAGGNPLDPAAAPAPAGNPGGGGNIPPPPQDLNFIGPPDFVDPEGRQLRAQHIVGQRHPFGPDVPMSHDEMLDIVRQLSQPQLGGSVEFHSPLFLPDGRRSFAHVGEVNAFNPPGGIDPHDAPLSPLKFAFDPDPYPGSPQQSRAAFRMAVPHELGHGIDFRLRNFDDVPIPSHIDPQDLEMISKHFRPDHWKPGAADPAYLHRPEELMADSIGTYLTEPEWMRDRVPNRDPMIGPPMGQDVAKWIRDRMNTDPKTKDLIQFNQFAPLMLGGGGGGALLKKRED